MRGLKLITGIRRDMKNYLMEFTDKDLLRKRFRIETIFGKLKEQMGLVQRRSRSVCNFFVHIVSCLATYQLNLRPLQQNTLHYLKKLRFL